MRFLKITEEKSFLFISLNRPELKNAFNSQMIGEINDAFKSISLRQDLKAIILKGEGKTFCTGGDLHWMKDMISYSAEENKDDASGLFEMFESLYHCQIPLIGVAHGFAFGGALGLLACCDYVISEESTQFCFSEVRLGLAPAVVSAFVLKKCDLGKVGHLMLMGRTFDAKEAQSVGLIHEVCPEGALPDRLKVALGWMREVGPEAVRATKSLIHRLPDLSWVEAKEESAEIISERRVSIEGQEGITAFFHKRIPSWRG